MKIFRFIGMVNYMLLFFEEVKVNMFLLLLVFWLWIIDVILFIKYGGFLGYFEVVYLLFLISYLMWINMF